MSVQIQKKRDTAANWTASNRVLGQGEPGFEVDTGKSKTGDGATAWNLLPYDAARSPLAAANNLSELASAATARTNLGLGTAATHAATDFDASGAATAALATAALKANNLSDLPSAATARTNLGMGTAATLASTAVAQTANNLSDVADAGSSRLNLHVAELAVCQAVATANVAALTGLQTIDGYTLLAGDLVLLTGQTTASQNGPWLAAAGAWTRPHEYATGGSVVGGRKTSVVNGTVNANSVWLLQTAGTVVPDTTATTWKPNVPSSVVIGSASIDICRQWSNGTTIYPGVTPGTDITATLQAAVNYVATFTYGGEIYFSVPGIYLISGAPQTGTAFTYNYNGQILFPAVTYTAGGNSVPIRIRGPFPASTGDQSNGQANGLVLLTNSVNSYVFDMIPAQSQYGYQWTAIMPIFRDLVVMGPTNPQCGGLNLSQTQRCRVDGVVFAVNGALGSSAPSGGLEALVLPQHENNGDFGDIQVRCQIRGWTTAMRVSEHAGINADISFCGTAFVKSDGAGGHANTFDHVDVEECQTIFSLSTSGTGLCVMGTMDMENTETSGTLSPQVFANIASGCGISGDLALNIDPNTGGLGYIGAGTMTMNLRPVGTGGAGSAAEQPADTLSRLNGTALAASSGAPGLCYPTLAGWRVTGGGFSLTGGVLKATATMGQACVASRERGKPRSWSAYFTTGASTYDCGLMVCRRYNTAASPFWARLHRRRAHLREGRPVQHAGRDRARRHDRERNQLPADDRGVLQRRPGRPSPDARPAERPARHQLPAHQRRPDGGNAGCHPPVPRGRDRDERHAIADQRPRQRAACRVGAGLGAAPDNTRHRHGDSDAHGTARRDHALYVRDIHGHAPPALHRWTAERDHQHRLGHDHRHATVGNAHQPVRRDREHHARSGREGDHRQPGRHELPGHRLMAVLTVGQSWQDPTLTTDGLTRPSNLARSICAGLTR